MYDKFILPYTNIKNKQKKKIKTRRNANTRDN